MDKILIDRAFKGGLTALEIQTAVHCWTDKILDEIKTTDELRDLFITFAEMWGFEHPYTVEEYLNYVFRVMKNRKKEASQKIKSQMKCISNNTIQKTDIGG